METYLGTDIQEKRILRSNHLFAEQSLRMRYIDENGQESHGGWQFGFREKMWSISCLLGSGEAEAILRANRMLRTMHSYTTTCVFSCCAIARIYAFSWDKLEEDNKAFLKNYVHLHYDEIIQPSMGFVGVNDNFPCMNLCNAVLYDTLFHDPIVAETAWTRANDLRNLLTMRGTMSEYGSPTYTAFQINGLANAINLLPDGALRDLLLSCETRLWYDVMARYCHATASMAGPFSRTSQIDSICHSHTIRPLYYAVLGDAMRIRPQDTYYDLKDGILPDLSAGNFPIYVQIAASFIQNAVYHVPLAYLEFGLHKKLPFAYRTTTEFSSSNDVGHNSQSFDPMALEDTYEYPSGNGYTTTYITEHSALGTATCEFHNGVQTDAFHFSYCTEGSEHPETRVKTIYSRYLINDTPFDIHEGLISDAGRKIAISDGNSALVLYKPKRFRRENVSSLKLTIGLYTGYSRPDAIYVGTQKLPEDGGHFDSFAPIFIADRNQYLCITPIVSDAVLPSAGMDITWCERYLTISFVNYRGPAATFAGNGILLIGNGFGFEADDAEQYPDFAAFRQKFASPDVTDQHISNEHSRYTSMRRVRYQNTRSALEIQYSPVSEGVKHILINGKPAAFDRIEAADDFDLQIPFI